MNYFWGSSAYRIVLSCRILQTIKISHHNLILIVFRNKVFIIASKLFTLNTPLCYPLEEGIINKSDFLPQDRPFAKTAINKPNFIYKMYSAISIFEDYYNLSFDYRKQY